MVGTGYLLSPPPPGGVRPPAISPPTRPTVPNVCGTFLPFATGGLTASGNQLNQWMVLSVPLGASRQGGPDGPLKRECVWDVSTGPPGAGRRTSNPEGSWMGRRRELGAQTPKKSLDVTGLIRRSKIRTVSQRMHRNLRNSIKKTISSNQQQAVKKSYRFQTCLRGVFRPGQSKGATPRGRGREGTVSKRGKRSRETARYMCET